MTLRPFTSESVTEGHPDKVCDRISDAILDEMLSQDPGARVAVETVVTTGLVHVVGEVSTTAYADIPGIVRREVTQIGYTSSEIGFDGDSCGVLVSIGEQSSDISGGVDKSLEARSGRAVDSLDDQGAGDQGTMFGYACTESPSLMPLPIYLAHRLSERLTEVRKNDIVPGLRPDGKTQVTLGYEGMVPRKVQALVISTQHEADLPDIEDAIRTQVINPVLAEHAPNLEQSGMSVFVNPAGPFVVGGPMGDAGLTGRKLIVDTYGGSARHGGGAFSGKDPSKVDRSASYAMRWVAKNIVSAGLADRVELQVAYGIGIARPIGLFVETFGTHHIDPARIERAVREVFDLRPAAIIRDLDLLRPIYKATSNYGHFGRDGFTWESTDRAEALRAAAGV